MSDDDKVVELEPGALRLFAAQVAQWNVEQEVLDTIAGMAQRRRTNAQRGATDGGSFVLDLPEHLPALWGSSTHPAWVEGEGLMLVGPQGVGKTTIAQQLVMAMAGLRAEVLDMPVKPVSGGRILYLAMDRPLQIARSWRRMVTEADREQLAERVTVWRGPLPFSLASAPRHLAAWARDEHGASVVLVDSYKDLSPDLSSETTGSHINEAMQEALAEGIQWVGLHHHRKGTADNPIPKTLADVYGSNWLTAGMGSVLGLGGDPGAELVEVRHLKQPAETLGTFGIRHDHARGISWRADDLPPSRAARKADDRLHADKLELAHAGELTVKEFAAKMQSSDKTAKRRLDALVDAGLAIASPGSHNTFVYRAIDGQDSAP